MHRSILSQGILSLGLTIASYGFAGNGKTLIDSKFQPNIATKMQDSPGVLTFHIPKGATVNAQGKDHPITLTMLKSSLERRLRQYAATYSGSAEMLTIRFDPKKVTKDDMLTAISRSYIKPSQNADIASSTSDGGVRARTTERQPSAGEIKGLFKKTVTAGILEVQIKSKGTPPTDPKAKALFAEIQVGSLAYLAHPTWQGLAGQPIYFFPVTKSKDPKTNKTIWRIRTANKAKK